MDNKKYPSAVKRSMRERNELPQLQSEWGRAVVSHTIQVDHSPADLFLVDDDTGRPIGRVKVSQISGLENPALCWTRNFALSRTKRNDTGLSNTVYEHQRSDTTFKKNITAFGYKSSNEKIAYTLADYDLNARRIFYEPFGIPYWDPWEKFQKEHAFNIDFLIRHSGSNFIDVDNAKRIGCPMPHKLAYQKAELIVGHAVFRP